MCIYYNIITFLVYHLSLTLNKFHILNRVLQYLGLFYFNLQSINKYLYKIHIKDFPCKAEALPDIKFTDDEIEPHPLPNIEADSKFVQKILASIYNPWHIFWRFFYYLEKLKSLKIFIDNNYNWIFRTTQISIPAMSLLLPERCQFRSVNWPLTFYNCMNTVSLSSPEFL